MLGISTSIFTDISAFKSSLLKCNRNNFHYVYTAYNLRPNLLRFCRNKSYFIFGALSRLKENIDFLCS